MEPSNELGKISKDERQTKLDAGQPVPPASHQKTPPKIERLQLPKGAMLAYRVSGGLKFSSREIVIYPDGRVAYGGADTSTNWQSRAQRKMNDGQITGLRKLLDQVGFFRAKSSTGEHGGDAIAYEIAAHLGIRSNSVELFTGLIPESLKPLVDQLNKLVPEV